MSKEELYKLSLDSYHEYPLLAELMAIRDERFKDEQQDSMLCVNGYISIDTLNNYVKLQQENQQLKGAIQTYDILLKANVEENQHLKEEKQELKKQLHEASLTIQEMTEQDIECPSNCDKMRKLLKESQQLKEKVDKQYNAIVEKDNMLSNRYGVIEHKQQQLDLYKSVFDEVREYIKESCSIELGEVSEYGDNINPREILEILDKAKESE